MTFAKATDIHMTFAKATDIHMVFGKATGIHMTFAKATGIHMVYGKATDIHMTFAKATVFGMTPSVRVFLFMRLDYLSGIKRCAREHCRLACLPTSATTVVTQTRSTANASLKQ